MKGKSNVKLNEGFIGNFKERHGIRHLLCVGERGSADKGAVDSFVQNFQEMILEENLTRDQIYNCDETGLCWQAIPGKTLAGPNELRVEGLKAEKERVTLMACANAAGTHKLNLVFIYKYQNLRSLKHIDKIKLPLIYYSLINAWMNTDLFERWYNSEFIPSVKSRVLSRIF